MPAVSSLKQNIDMTRSLVSGASHYGISLDEKTVSSFERYYELIATWNRRMNLISTRDCERFFDYHILDSLKVASCVDLKPVSRMMDFGSGAGLPGIPLSIVFPHIAVTLVESRLKRCLFLNEAVSNIPDLHVTVIRSRVEELPEKFNDSFDMVITRATMNLEKFFICCRRFITPHGSLVAIKGDSIKNELLELQKHVNSRFFHIHTLFPKAVENVRSGTIITIKNI